jgi:hypothetical protein
MTIKARSNLCQAIQIYGWVGNSTTDPNGRTMDMNEFAPFRDHVADLMAIIATTKAGRRLFGHLDATNKRVRVHSGADLQDNACKMDPNTADNGRNSAILTFRPAHHNNPIGLKGSENAWRGLDPNDDRTAAKDNVKNQMGGYGFAVKKADTAPVLDAVLARTQMGNTLSPQMSNTRFSKPKEQLPKRLNITAAAFRDMYEGRAYIPDDVYYPLCFLLYDYVIPGAGTNAQVRLMNAMTFAFDFKNDVDAMKTKKFTRDENALILEAVVFAHELIHAWRMMAGRRVVTSGWEEEAMTTGIGPFSGWRMTENAFRAELGLKARTSYANPTHSSNLAQTWSTATTSTTGYRGMMF